MNRVGIGYDAHRFIPGRKLVIGGVAIDYSRGLEGHSDADVLIHAIMDAMLGAAGMGDLGTHFPDSDPAYKGISSLKLLKEVAGIIREAGFDAVNIDGIIVAQEPRMSPYIGKMKANIADTVGLHPARVNVKATTTEGMGFEGRKEGIGAQAVVLLSERQHSTLEEKGDAML
ncbi:MAG: 2-C-methyl-D-erythritol 2,4-cyclodiphosphate synthase [Firmicutes bacterium]|nr:2-C-methyl-D-erythritol 2,4-cyclodiphosphate synthase [Bacillota bacterium]MDI6706474.1 2-C-methyl-D-erythritol 2,4-cyclodiphosphate synthase [Bacillota bacterium]